MAIRGKRRRPMTIAEKILAKHAGLKEVSPGELLNAKVDIALGYREG